MHPIFASGGQAANAVPIWFVTAATHDAVLKRLDSHERAFARNAGFEPKAGRHLLLSGADGKLAGVLFGLEAADDPARDMFRPGILAGLLPAGTYRFASAPHDARLAALAIALGAYQYGRYRKAQDRAIKLVVPDGVDGNELTRIVEGMTLAR
jgi:leucyl aminopeptidase